MKIKSEKTTLLLAFSRKELLYKVLSYDSDVCIGLYYNTCILTFTLTFLYKSWDPSNDAFTQPEFLINSIIDMFGFSKRPQPTIKICTGQVMAKSTQKELEKHYSFMLSSSKQELKSYIQSGVVSGKFWMTGKEKEVCYVCRENERVGAIPFNAKFPSGHLYPPAGELCRCILGGKTDENA